MNRIPVIQTDLIFSDTPAAEGEATASETPAAAPVEASESKDVQEVTATTEQPVPLAPPHTGVLEPISGTQSAILVGFGVLAFIILVAMTKFGSDHDYGD